MRKQLKKALSMVLTAAMVLSLGSGISFKTAGAAEEGFEAKLSGQMNTDIATVGEWGFAATAPVEMGKMTTISWASATSTACFSGNFVGIDTNITYEEGQTAKIYSIKVDGEECAYADASKAIVAAEGDNLRITLANRWGGIEKDKEVFSEYKGFKSIEITLAIGDASNPIPTNKASLSGQMNTDKCTTKEWGFGASAWFASGVESTIKWANATTNACFSGNFVGIDTDLPYEEGIKAKITSIKVDGAECDYADVSKAIVGENDDGNLRITLANRWGGIEEDKEVFSKYEAFNSLEISFVITLPTGSGDNGGPSPATPKPSPSQDPGFDKPVAQAKDYHAYLGFQTNVNWLVRDAWCANQSTAAKKKMVNGNGLNVKTITVNAPDDDSKTVEVAYDFNKQFYKTGSGTAPYAKAGTYNATFTNATITENGKQYSVKMSGADFSKEKWNMLYVSTDIATSQTNVKFSNATIVVDGKTVATAPMYNKKDAAETYGYYQMMIVNPYGSKKDGTKVTMDDIKGLVMQKDSIEIKFTVSGIDFTKDQQVIKTEATGVAKGKTFSAGNLKYKVTTGATKLGSKVTAGKVQVVGLSTTGKKKTSITVPKTVSKSGGVYKVTSLSAKTFAKAKKVKSVSFKSATYLKSLPTGAFSGAKALTTVTLNKYMKKVPAKAFVNCKKLSKLVLNAKVTSVKKGAFKGCKKTIKVSAKKSIKKASLKKLKKCGYKKFK